MTATIYFSFFLRVMPGSFASWKQRSATWPQIQPHGSYKLNPHNSGSSIATISKLPFPSTISYIIIAHLREEDRHPAMASAKLGSSPSEWTRGEDKMFERALAVYDTDTPDRWHNVARYMGGTKSVDEVRRHYQLLVRDVAQIESGGVPFHWYAAAPPPPTLQRGNN